MLMYLSISGYNDLICVCVYCAILCDVIDGLHKQPFLLFFTMIEIITKLLV